MPSRFPVPTRRAVLAGLVSLSALPVRAAVTVEAARGFVEETVAELFAIARSGKGLPAQRADLRALLLRRMAVQPVARTILGPVWREISPAQQKAYVDAFLDYVTRKYGARFDEFTQVSISVLRVSDFGERGVVVETRASLPSGETAAIDWGVSDRGGPVQITNIVVEGVSLVTSEREMIAGMLDRAGGSVDRLIAELAVTN